MASRKVAKSVLTLSLMLASAGSYAATEVQFWHSMEGELGNEVNSLAQRFNQAHPQYQVVPVYKGDYQQSLAAGIAAVRSGHAPAILQVYEAGTATMMASKAIKPAWEVFRDAGVALDEQQFIPTILGYYSDSAGHMLSEPFNSSTPVLYYNKEAFRKAGLNPDQPPTTWQQLEKDAVALKKAGMSCGFTSGWQGWIHLEEFSTWHGLPIASKNNGFDGTDTRLLINGPEQIRHVDRLAKMSKEGTFSYFGRTDQSTPKFYNGDCAMMTASSASLADIRHNTKFEFGVGMLPYDEEVKNAPQNAIIGGASLWVMQGKSAETYQGAAEFMKFLASPEIAAEWHQQTGYLPVTNAGYKLTQEQGFYQKNPESEIAIRQMLNKPPLPFTKGLRLGNLPQIRTIMDEELESVWTGKKGAKQALDETVSRGNQLLERFQQQVK